MPTSLTSAVSPEIIREHGLTPDEYEKIKQLLGGREPTHHRTRHLQRDVERALLLQIVARAPEAAADAQQARAAGAGGERRHHRHRRWLGLRVQDRVAQSSVVHRAVSGRDDRRGRNPARHFHDGRAAGCGDGFAALRPDHDRRPRQPRSASYARRGSSESLHPGRRGQRGRLLRELLWRAEPWAARRSSSRATRAIRW